MPSRKAPVCWCLQQCTDDWPAGSQSHSGAGACAGASAGAGRSHQECRPRAQRAVPLARWPADSQSGQFSEARNKMTARLRWAAWLARLARSGAHGQGRLCESGGAGRAGRREDAISRGHAPLRTLRTPRRHRNGVSATRPAEAFGSNRHADKNTRTCHPIRRLGAAAVVSV